MQLTYYPCVTITLNYSDFLNESLEQRKMEMIVTYQFNSTHEIVVHKNEPSTLHLTGLSSTLALQTALFLHCVSFRPAKHLHPCAAHTYLHTAASLAKTPRNTSTKYYFSISEHESGIGGRVINSGTCFPLSSIHPISVTVGSTGQARCACTQTID